MILGKSTFSGKKFNEGILGMNWEKRWHFPPWNIIIYSFIFSRPNILKNERVFFRLLSFLALPQTLFNLVGLVRKIFGILLTFIDVFVFHCLFCFLLYVLLFVVCFCFLFYVLFFIVCFAFCRSVCILIHIRLLFLWVVC